MPNPSLRRHEGYLLIDNRHAAVPDSVIQVAREHGKHVAGAGVRGMYESAVVTCAHCHTQVVLNPERTRERGYCRKCDHYVCDNPLCNADCRPFNRVLDDLQEQAARAQNIIIL